MFYRRGRSDQLDQEARPGLCFPVSLLGKQKNNTSKQPKASSGCSSEDRKDLFPCWSYAQAKHGGTSRVRGCVFHISASVNFPVLKNYPGLPNTLNFGGLFPFSCMGEDLGPQPPGCGVSSSVSSRIKYGVTADNSCSM